MEEKTYQTRPLVRMSEDDAYQLGQELGADCMDLVWARHDEIAEDRYSPLNYREQLQIMEGLTEYIDMQLNCAREAKRNHDRTGGRIPSVELSSRPTS